MIASEEPVLKQDRLPSTEGSPFDLPPDPEGDKNALTKSLQIAMDFALHFVVSEVSRVRPRLMDEIEARLPGKTIQRIHITKETTNLLHTFQEHLQNPLPDIVFVSGFENIISAAAEPRSHPLLLNLNATRNNFYALVPRPVVLWVPPFALRTIAQAAPDFVSVRSGVYTFALSAEEQQQMKEIAYTTGQIEILGFNQMERDRRIEGMQNLLLEYRSFPVSERNRQDELLIMSQLGISYMALGNYTQAEYFFNEALLVSRAILPEDHPDIAGSLNNLASLYKEQNKYKEAEPLFDQALSISRTSLPKDHPDIATSLNNLAGLYQLQGRYSEAKVLYDESLSIRRSCLPEPHPDVATSLNNLAGLYELQGLHDEAEPLYIESLSMRRATLPELHPDIAASLNNLAAYYKYIGRYNESETLYDESLLISRASLPKGHPNIAMSLNNLAALYEAQGRHDETEPLYNEAFKILQTVFNDDHPLLQRVRIRLANLLSNKMRRTATSTHPDIGKVSLESMMSALKEKPKTNKVLIKTSPKKRKSQKGAIRFKPLL